MITDRTLAHLRTSAAAALLVPGLSVTVEVEGRIVVEATRPPFLHDDHPVLSICAFHRSVVRAHELRQRGSRVEMVGLAGDLEPTVELVPGPDVRIVPGGVIRVRGDESCFHLCPLSFPVERVEAAAVDVSDRCGVIVDLHADRSLDVTVAMVETPRGEVRAGRAAVEALEQLAAVATVDALVELVQPEITDWEALLR